MRSLCAVVQYVVYRTDLEQWRTRAQPHAVSGSSEQASLRMRHLVAGIARGQVNEAILGPDEALQEATATTTTTTTVDSCQLLVLVRRRHWDD